MSTAVKMSLMAIIISGVTFLPVANATNGYFAHGYSTAEKGLAGAGTAYSQDAMAAATNPAGMAFIGSRMDIGLALFSPAPRGYTATGTSPASDGDPVFVPSTSLANCQFLNGDGSRCNPPFSVNSGEFESGNELFLIPFFGRNWQLNEDVALGLSVYSNGGMNTEYLTGNATGIDYSTLLISDSLPGAFGDGVAGVNFEQIFFNVSLASKLNDTDGVGVSLIFAAQRFSAKGLAQFGNFSLDPNNLSSNEHSVSYGAGLKLGYQGDVADGVRVGASYQSKINMSKFDEYAGLFAGAGEFDIPSTYNVGLAIDVGKTGVIVLDVQRINYTDTKAISNSIAALGDGSCLDSLNATLIAASPTTLPATGAGCLGGANGAGFGWQDVTIVKLGYQFDVDDMTYRFGYSHTGEVIPESETLFNILAPAVTEHHFTAGLTARFDGNKEFSLSGLIAPKGEVTGDNPFDGGATQIEIEMFQWEVQAGWAWKY